MDHYDRMFAGLLVLLAFAGALLDEAVTGSQDMEPFAYIALECQFLLHRKVCVQNQLDLVAVSYLYKC